MGFGSWKEIFNGSKEDVWLRVDRFGGLLAVVVAVAEELADMALDAPRPTAVDELASDVSVSCRVLSRRLRTGLATDGWEDRELAPCPGRISSWCLDISTAISAIQSGCCSFSDRRSFSLYAWLRRNVSVLWTSAVEGTSTANDSFAKVRRR